MTDDPASDPTTLAARAPLYLFAFEESAHALDAQERAVNELRSRAGVLMAASAVATSFFGGRAMDGQHFETATWLGVVAFALVSAAVLVVLWPRPVWRFHVTAAELIAGYIEPEPLPLELVHRDIALHQATSLAQNTRQLQWLIRAFRSGLLLFVVEMAAWLVALADAT